MSTDTDSPGPPQQRSERPRARLLLLIAGGVALSCLAALVAIALIGLSIVPARSSRATSTTTDAVGGPAGPAVSDPAYTSSPAAAVSSTPVEGGLTDSLLRSQVWSTIISFHASVRGCTEVSSTKIETTMEPDARGSWEEDWTIVACGETKRLKVKFTAAPDGGVYYDIVE